MIKGSTVVKIALQYNHRAENPLGSNSGPFVEDCQHATFLAGTGWPWCAAFVCYVAKQAGVPLSYASAGANDLFNHYKAAGRAISFANAKPGDVVDFNIGSGHTGILLSATGDTVTTIDGNWGDRVTEVVHPLSLVRGIWRIPGVNDTTPPPPPKLPAFVVTTSASGHRKVVFTAQKKTSLIKWLTTHNLAKLFPNGITITRGKS